MPKFTIEEHEKRMRELLKFKPQVVGARPPLLDELLGRATQRRIRRGVGPRVAMGQKMEPTKPEPSLPPEVPPYRLEPKPRPKPRTETSYKPGPKL